MNGNFSRNVFLLITLHSFERDGEVVLKLTPRERTMLLDALAAYCVRATDETDFTIFTDEEINKLGQRINNIK